MATSKMNQPTLQELYKELAFIAQQNKKIFIGEECSKRRSIIVSIATNYRA